MITRSDILAHLEHGMRTGFLNGIQNYTPIRSSFVEEVASDGAFETYADMGQTPWPRQNGGQTTGNQGTDARTGGAKVSGLHEGEAITVLGGNERTMTVYNNNWDVPIGITHDAINDARVGSLEDWARAAGMRFEQHKDYLSFNALNSGEAATNYGNAYDNIAFFAATHIDPGAEYQTAQDNQYALALSLDNFETVRVAGASFLDDRGQPASMMHNLLITAIELERTAAQITDNPEDPDTANRAINPYAGLVTRLSAPGGWLDSTAWYVVSNLPNMKPLGLQMRQSPTLATWDDHSQGGSGIRYFKWVARYTIFYRNWRTAVQGNT